MPNKRTNSVQENVTIEYVPIKVSAGILLHIGAGIYQSVAGAIKELVNNAYDADAPQVTVSMGYPDFDQIKVVDNGTGMDKERFKQAMASIGSSLKGVKSSTRKTKEFERPVIGRLGIGLMALSQVCSMAEIESQTKGSDKKFIARLDFSQFKTGFPKNPEAMKLDVEITRYGGLEEMNRLHLDVKTNLDVKAEIAQILAAHQALSKFEGSEGEQLGYCVVYPDLPAIKGEHGTTITLKEIDKTVKNTLKDTGRSRKNMPKFYAAKKYDWETYRNEINKMMWADLCDDLSVEAHGITYELLPKYHQFLWELSLLTPVKYLPNSPVTIKPAVLKKKKSELEDFNFTLNVDNRAILKPALLPSGTLRNEAPALQPKYDYTVSSLDFNEVVDGQRLKAHGYIFWQKTQVKPRAISGVQIYIRNVGIGLYDPGFMNFSAVNLTSRAGQMSGEIYVEEGLERALNVDRNSFRVTDEHYVALQRYLWKKLGSAARGEGILGGSIDSYWIRKGRSDEEAKKLHIEDLTKVVEVETKGKVKLIFSEESDEQPYTLSNNIITIFDGSALWPRSGKDRRLAQSLIIRARAAQSAGLSTNRILDRLESILLAKWQRDNV
jgi:hypothetical protein